MKYKLQLSLSTVHGFPNCFSNNDHESKPVVLITILYEIKILCDKLGQSCNKLSRALASCQLARVTYSYSCAGAGAWLSCFTTCPAVGWLDG